MSVGQRLDAIFEQLAEWKALGDRGLALADCSRLLVAQSRAVTEQARLVIRLSRHALDFEEIGKLPSDEKRPPVQE